MSNVHYYVNVMRVNPHIKMLPEVFEDLSGIPGELILEASSREKGVNQKPWPSRVDAMLKAGDWTFLVEYKKQYSSESIAGVTHRLAGIARERCPQISPLLVVPYMGETGRDLCRSAGINWLDLSGNAEIHLPGLRILVLGRANKFKRRGRPKSLFAPATSRIARALLLEPEGYDSQKELAAYTDLSESWVSRSIRRLEEAGFIERENRLRLRATEAGRFVEQWRIEYDFFAHEVHRTHIAVRSGEEMLHLVSDNLAGRSIRYAATGLGAAWLYSRYAAFRTTTFFVENLPPEHDMSDWGLRRVESGSNLWLAIPNDEGVYMGMKEINGIPCVSPLQVYLDLQHHPERSEDAAEHLRSRFLEALDG